jgi:four helix bundle protein
MTEIDDKGLETLVVWQKAIQFAKYICGIVVSQLPEQEKYALVSQIRRSAQSVHANIAEGYGRFYYQEGIRFAYIARGSLEETRSHLTYAHEMMYISNEEFDKIKMEIDVLKKLLNGYINYLKRTKRGVSEPGAQYFTQRSEVIDDLDPNS